jgi:PKD domain/L,D-transpeptidase catalytic domain/Putative peptidoglycan binding domain
MTRRRDVGRRERPLRMRRLVLLASASSLVWAHTAHAAASTFAVQASPLAGAAPLHVTFTTTGGPASPLAYSWDFGDGTQAVTGAATEHTYAAAGRYTATVSAASQGGQTVAAHVQVTAYALTLRGPVTAAFGRRVTFRGVLQPAEPGARIVLSRDGKPLAARTARSDGTFRIRVRLRAPGAYQTAFGAVESNPKQVTVRPRLRLTLRGAALVGNRLTVVARLQPASAGKLRVAVDRPGRRVFDGTGTAVVRTALRTSAPVVYTARAWTEPAAGFSRAARARRISVAVPTLSVGSHGRSVWLLERRLADLHYLLARVDGFYGTDTYDAVLAFEKVNWLPRTGSVDRRVWTRLAHASVPRARYRSGAHVEVDKARQVLFDVRGGEVTHVVQVSTGATGNTPVGIWHVYSKEAGFNAKSMFDSLYFLRGFAIHGYPYVPPYPASHGCVRVPLWAAPALYATHSYGTTVIIY